MCFIDIYIFNRTSSELWSNFDQKVIWTLILMRRTTFSFKKGKAMYELPTIVETNILTTRTLRWFRISLLLSSKASNIFMIDMNVLTTSTSSQKLFSKNLIHT